MNRITTSSVHVEAYTNTEIEDNGTLFVEHLPSGKRKIGIVDGKYNIPDDMDFCNEEVASMFYSE